MDQYLYQQTKASVHEVGLRDLLAMGKLSGDLPSRRALLAVQPQQIAWGESLTPPLAAALPQICLTARQLAQRWFDEPD
ncbi:MAG: hypothetical protein HQL49_13865 [Gammaproteobacteria bacterium]|nr:hypothetical protein [Gammaproteobacteria bacterium]